MLFVNWKFSWDISIPKSKGLPPIPTSFPSIPAENTIPLKSNFSSSLQFRKIVNCKKHYTRNFEIKLPHPNLFSWPLIFANFAIKKFTNFYACGKKVSWRSKTQNLIPYYTKQECSHLQHMSSRKVVGQDNKTTEQLMC